MPRSTFCPPLPVFPHECQVRSISVVEVVVAVIRESANFLGVLPATPGIERNPLLVIVSVNPRRIEVESETDTPNYVAAHINRAEEPYRQG